LSLEVLRTIKFCYFCIKSR